MNVIVTGATGFVGSALLRALTGASSASSSSSATSSGPGLPPSLGASKVTALVRDVARGRRALAEALDPAAGKASPLDENRVRVISVDDGPGLRASLAAADAVVNLAGESLFSGRWTEERKRSLRASRVATTERLVRALAEARPASAPLPVLLSTSAVGYYGDAGDRVLDEEASPSHGGVAGADFAAELCRDWEAAALAARPHASRIVLQRFGILLGKGGGALAAMRPLFRAGLGGRLGDGKQWVSWMHLDDVVAALLAALPGGALSTLDGPVNFVAPEPATNRQLTEALGEAVHRPTILPAPAFALSLALGERAGLLLSSQRVVPRALLAAGFTFRHPALGEAVADALAEPGAADAKPR